MTALIEKADPVEVRSELLWFIEDAIRNHPRSLQKKIGPSEIGHDCGRWLGYKLADAPVFNDFAKSRDAWRPTVGTAVHAWLADVFEAVNVPGEEPLFYVEKRLNVGKFSPVDGGDPEDVTGSGDLYYRGVAIDWKIVGANTLKKAKTVSRATKMPHGPSQRYRKQINLYGTGWIEQGLPVHTVMIVMLPASGELRADSAFWSEDFDPAVAAAAMARADGTNSLIRAAKAQGKQAMETVLGMLPTADSYCTSCDYFVPGADASGNGLTKGCGGDPGRYMRRDSNLSLVPPGSV